MMMTMVVMEVMADGHGDDGDLFTIEHDGGEDDDGHGERENKEAELGRAGLEDCFRTSYFLYICESLYLQRVTENSETLERKEIENSPSHVSMIIKYRKRMITKFTWE